MKVDEMAALFNNHTLEEIEALYAIAREDIMRAALRVQTLNRFKDRHKVSEGHLTWPVILKPNDDLTQALKMMYDYKE